MNNQNETIKLAKEKVNNVNRGRIRDNKNTFVALNVVSIVTGTPAHLISNHMKHIDVPKTTNYILFRIGNVRRKQLIDAVVDIN